MTEINKWQIPQPKHNLEIETEKQWERVQREGEIPWPWPTSQWTGGAFFGPWKVWLSSGFPEPGKFPQWRSMAPLSARNAGPQYRLCQIPRLGRRGKAGGLGVKNQLFNVCCKHTHRLKRHTLTGGQPGPKWGHRPGASEWKRAALQVFILMAGKCARN